MIITLAFGRLISAEMLDEVEFWRRIVEILPVERKTTGERKVRNEVVENPRESIQIQSCRQTVHDPKLLFISFTLPGWAR